MNVHHHSRGLGMTSGSRRDQLIAELRGQGIHHEKVLKVMAKVPRHEFVGEALRSKAYVNTALPIGQAQTISQPYVVALMSQTILGASIPVHKVLEVGTGSGYQTAVLAELVHSVFSVERIKALSESARQRLARLNYHNILFGYADGNLGWAINAPYDAILVTAGASALPDSLVRQLAVGGRMVIPVGPSGQQQLQLVERTRTGTRISELAKVSFVPLLSGKI